MPEAKIVVTYLLYNKLVTNHKIKDWIDIIFDKSIINSSNVFPNDIYLNKVRDLRNKNLITPRIASVLEKITLWMDEAVDVYNKLLAQNILIVTIHDDKYPKALLDIEDRPYIVFIRGDINIFSNDTITIVGTRNNSNYAAIKTLQFVEESIKCELTTVSGFARGIDTLVLDKSLENGGSSIVVLPELRVNKKSRSNVLEISEYLENIKIPVMKWQYVARNRIAAALSPYTVVVEAPIRSGTLITAELALMYDKSVYTVLPNVFTRESYGGIAFTQSRLEPKFVNSLYDIFFDMEENSKIQKFYKFIKLKTRGYIDIKSNEYRNLNDIDLRRYILDGADRDLEEFNRRVVELLRLGIILEMKNKIVFNFSGNKRWQKI